MLSSLISDSASAHSTAMRPKWLSHWPPAMSQNKGQKLEYQGFIEGKDTLHIPPFFDNNFNCVPKFQNKKTPNIRRYLKKLIASGSRHVILTKFNDISRLHTWIPEVLESRTSVNLCPQGQLVLVPRLQRLRGSGGSGDENDPSAKRPHTWLF